MDISKLPKLSRSDAPPPNEPDAPPPPQRAPEDRAYDPVPGLAEAWISIVLGIILLLMFPNTLKYVRSPSAFAQKNQGVYTDKDGAPMDYSKSAFIWTDAGVTIFSVALLIEGLGMILSKKLWLLWATFLLTLAAAFFNLYVIIRTSGDIALPVVCALAVAVGGYMAITQWRLITILKRRAQIKKIPA